MKHIIHLPGGGWDLKNYFHYLSTVKDQLPLDVINFACNPQNYDLLSHHSLHDAWLECLSISEPATGSRSEIRQTQIDCKYLGPYHDLYIYITYFGVADYSLTTPNKINVNVDRCSGHGDLLMHEVRVGTGRRVVHEIHFSRGSVFEISCTHFSHRIERREASSDSSIG